PALSLPLTFWLWALRAPSTFFIHDTASPHIYTLSLHDALPILKDRSTPLVRVYRAKPPEVDSSKPIFLQICVSLLIPGSIGIVPDRKSTRLNSSHVKISYAVFCLKKKRRQSRRAIGCSVL